MNTIPPIEAVHHERRPSESWSKGDAMYIAILALTMFILPIGSVLLALGSNPNTALIDLLGLWFVFWAVGVRLGIAGVRQILHPEFTARDIFKLEGDGPLVIVRELGFANFAIGIVALLTLLFPSFVMPAALYASIFYAAAGGMHVREPKRGRNENIAMVTDLLMALVLGGFVIAKLVQL